MRQTLLFLGFALFITAGFIYLTIRPLFEKDVPPEPNHVTWHEAKIKVDYSNNKSDTFNIDVYENLDNIRVENGNLSYNKATKETGGVVAYTVKLASYVRSYKVLNQIERHK